MRDFTLNIYKKLFEKLLQQGYQFITYSQWIELGTQFLKSSPLCILRHDVDRLPMNSLITAKFEKSLDIKGSYYFRMIPAVFNESIIKEIESLGHEIGYHYETMTTSNGDIDKAYDEFQKNLAAFRKIANIKTICMHGSPLSKYDNRQLWTKFDYKKSGVIGEPYFDIDWNEFGYLTDTGRRWNGSEVSIRDKVDSEFKFNFKTTYDIIENIDQLPDKIMITIHPQRWSDNPILWLEELVMQNIKNIVKKIIVKK